MTPKESLRQIRDTIERVHEKRDKQARLSGGTVGKRPLWELKLLTLADLGLAPKIPSEDPNQLQLPLE